MKRIFLLFVWADTTHCIHSNGESYTIKLSHANKHIRRYVKHHTFISPVLQKNKHKCKLITQFLSIKEKNKNNIFEYTYIITNLHQFVKIL